MHTQREIFKFNYEIDVRLSHRRNYHIAAKQKYTLSDTLI